MTKLEYFKMISDAIKPLNVEDRKLTLQSIAHFHKIVQNYKNMIKLEYGNKRSRTNSLDGMAS